MCLAVRFEPSSFVSFFGFGFAFAFAFALALALVLLLPSLVEWSGVEWSGAEWSGAAWSGVEDVGTGVASATHDCRVKTFA